MDKTNGVMLILAVLAIVLVIGVFRKKAEWIINLVLRGVFGMMAIYFINYFMAERFPALELGYNLITFLTSGILGFPGVVMLYGINIYMFL